MERHGASGPSSRYPTRRNSANIQAARQLLPFVEQTGTRQQIPTLMPPPFRASSGTRATEYRHELQPMNNPSDDMVNTALQSPVEQYPPNMSTTSPGTQQNQPPSQRTRQMPLPSPGGLTNPAAVNGSPHADMDNLPTPPLNRDFPDYPQSAYNYGTWTAVEDKTLMSARGQGHHWSSIQRTHFPSKTANACRKRHERLMERRGIYDLDREKLERVAHEYMGMRKEIWSGLAARVGERWNVVEAQCMSAGLRTIQLNARSHARRQRQETRVSQRTATNPFHPLNTDMNLTLNDMHHLPNGSGPHASNMLAPVGFAPISPLDNDSAAGSNQHPPSWMQHEHGHGAGRAGREDDEDDDGDGGRTPVAEQRSHGVTSPSVSEATGGGGSNVQFMGYLSGQVSQKR